MPNLELPASNSCVRVRAIDAKTYMSLHSIRFIEPQIEGFETLNLTNICFLIDHMGSGKRLLFDCGARTDFWNYSPATKARLNMVLKGIRAEADVNDILVGAGIELETITAMIWSHWHWDHHGAASKYPTSVVIVVGPGFIENFTPGYPSNPDAPLLDADFRDHLIKEISFDNSKLMIGDFRAFDYFGNGSFYLLDSPGHAIGHMCGLARTTPTTFVFMGGDICHYSGMHRPTPEVPLPDPVPPEQLDDWFPSPCPCSIFTETNRRAPGDTEASRTTPFFEVTSMTPCSYLDKKTAVESIQK